jgi:hypothetical protein
MSGKTRQNFLHGQYLVTHNRLATVVQAMKDGKSFF